MTTAVMAGRNNEVFTEDTLQCFLQGKDSLSELAFLDALIADAGIERGKPSLGVDIENGNQCEKQHDVNVSDIKFTLFDFDTSTGNQGKISENGNENVHNHHEVAAGAEEFSERNAAVNLTQPNVPAIQQEILLHGCDGNVQNSEVQENNVQSCYAKSVVHFWNMLSSSENCVCAEDVSVETFVQYVFTRRYGPADEQFNDIHAAGMRTDPQAVADLNRRLDAVVKRLMELPVTVELASAYSSVLQKATGMPTLRKRILEHSMLWMSRQKAVLNGHVSRHVKTLVIAGLSDVWSAVRRACSNGVSRVFTDWSHSQQEDLFNSLLEICIDKEGSWQSKDGAALCVHALLFNCFTPSSQNNVAAVDLPSYIVECVLTIVFSLISHPQQSVRETVSKIMSVYMEHVDPQDMMDLMHQTLTLLTPPVAGKQVPETFHCVEAYAAEGLLNICTSIFKVLPVRKAVHLWLTHRNAFLTYLSHDASSVRQTTSTLIFHVATHRRSSAALMKLVIHHLTLGWPVDLQSLSSCHHFLPGGDDTVTWEGKEGRMFVYELLCKHLIETYTACEDHITNGAVLQSACSQDGGSEEESEEEVYKGVGHHLASQSPLMQLYLLDNADRLADETAIKVLRDSEIQDLQRWLLLHSPCLSHGRDKSVPCDASDDLVLPSCEQLMMAMLHHTAVCLAHTQWELRRIAQQVLPCLCEVMCLYDVHLIMGVWRYITEETNLPSLLGLCALQQSLALCARVVATADLSVKDANISNPIYIGFVDGVRRHVGDYLPLVVHHLGRTTYDKMSVVAAEIALLALNFFELHKQIQEDLSSALVCLWKNLFSFAHPKSAIATSLFPSLQHEFSSPHEGFLSCCLVRPETKAQCAKQVEKSLMLAIHAHLPHFLPQLDSHNAALCLPLLAHNIGLFIDDTDVCKSLISSFSTLCQCTKKLFTSMASDVSSASVAGDMSLKCVYFTIRELTAVIALKNLDVALLQKILTCYLTVCQSLQPDTHIPLLLQGVSARLNNSESDTSLNRSGSSLGLQIYHRSGRRRTLSTTDDILEIREVATRLSPRDKGEEVEEGEEEEEEEEESDWDSWSEEELDEKQSSLQTHFRDFFERLIGIYGAEGRRMLCDGVASLGQKEQDTLKELLPDT